MKIEKKSHYILIYYVYQLFLTKLFNFIAIQKFTESVFKVYSDENYYRVAVEAMIALFLLSTVLAPYIWETF